jgi:hypothetical protein
MISAFLVMTDHGAVLGILIADLIGHYQADRHKFLPDDQHSRINVAPRKT